MLPQALQSDSYLTSAVTRSCHAVLSHGPVTPYAAHACTHRTLLSLIDSQALSDVKLHAVFQVLNAQLLSFSQEKNTLLNELITLQDNFLQEQSTTTVLIFLTDSCVLQLIRRSLNTLIREMFDVKAAILNREES